MYVNGIYANIKNLKNEFWVNNNIISIQLVQKLCQIKY